MYRYSETKAKSKKASKQSLLNGYGGRREWTAENHGHELQGGVGGRSVGHDDSGVRFDGNAMSKSPG